MVADAADSTGTTALYWAARNGQSEIAHELLQVCGVNVNVADNSGTTALYWAARNGQREIVRQLLQVRGVDVNAADSTGTTALYWATRNGHREIVRELRLKQRQMELWRHLRDAVRVRPYAIFWLQFVQERRYRPGGIGFMNEVAEWESMVHSSINIEGL